jgi:hypothetical protein
LDKIRRAGINERNSEQKTAPSKTRRKAKNNPLAALTWKCEKRRIGATASTANLDASARIETTVDSTNGRRRADASSIRRFLVSKSVCAPKRPVITLG